MRLSAGLCSGQRAERRAKMAIGDDGMSRAVARCRSLDAYSLWRALKDLENEIYSIKRANEPIPIEMIRMRAVLLRARSVSE
jgi:hypothetical protein